MDPVELPAGGLDLRSGLPPPVNGSRAELLQEAERLIFRNGFREHTGQPPMATAAPIYDALSLLTTRTLCLPQDLTRSVNFGSGKKF